MRIDLNLTSRTVRTLAIFVVVNALAILVCTFAFAQSEPAPSSSFLGSVWAWITVPSHMLFEWPLITALASLAYAKVDATTRGHAFLQLLAGVGFDLPKVLAMLQQLFTGKTAAQRAAAKLAASAAKVTVFAFFLSCIAATQSGCLADAPVVPVTPQNQAQVTACENTAALHNGFVIGDFSFTAVGTGAGAIAAVDSNTNVKTAMGITAGIAGAGAIAASSIVALSSSNFANDQCSSVVGALPTAGATPGGGK